MSIFRPGDEPPVKKFKERGPRWGVVPEKEKNPLVDDNGEDIIENSADNDTKKVIVQFASLDGVIAVTYPFPCSFLFLLSVSPAGPPNRVADKRGYEPATRALKFLVRQCNGFFLSQSKILPVCDPPLYFYFVASPRHNPTRFS